MDRCELKPGNRFSPGGTSGIGHAAIKIARRLALRYLPPLAPRNAPPCVILVSIWRSIEDEDFYDAAIAATSGRGVDVIIDIITGDASQGSGIAGMAAV